MQMVENDFFQLLVNLLLFPKNNISLPLDSRVLQLGVLKDVTDDIDGDGNILAETLGVVHGLLAGRVSIEMGTNILDLQLQTVLRPFACALEGHVFQEMRGAVSCVGLCS